MNLFDAEILAKELISEHIPHYRFGWMNEKTVNGRCRYDSKTIVLSRPRTTLRTRDAVRNTIMHEIAHALTPEAGHGRAWKMQMIRFGLKPERCSSDAIDESRISNWRAVCKGCGKISYMIRKPRVDRSCGECSPKVYNEKYLLTYKRM